MAKPSFYDDNPDYDYTHYWEGRDYENSAEQLAVAKLLRGKHFKTAADIGGGYGRLCLLLQHYADKVTLVEPSQHQRELANDFLKDSGVVIVDGSSNNTTIKEGAVDLITMVRVMHHLPKPEKTFKELHRILASDGYLVLEVASSLHAKSRVKRWLRGQRTPIDPIDIKTRSTTDIDEESPFVNHHPARVEEQLRAAGFEVVSKLSASNLRSQALKKILPAKVMLGFEKLAQRPLAHLDFGPSLFYLLKKRT